MSKRGPFILKQPKFKGMTYHDYKFFVYNNGDIIFEEEFDTENFNVGDSYVLTKSTDGCWSFKKLKRPPYSIIPYPPIDFNQEWPRKG